MKAILKFENGQEEILTGDVLVPPDAIRMYGCLGLTFNFVLVDELPSGAYLYREEKREISS